MKSYIKIIQKYVKKHLEQNGFDKLSIKRIVEDDLSYLTEWVLKPNSLEELKAGEAYVLPAFGYAAKNKKSPDKSEHFDPKIHKPGESNEAIARVVVNLFNKGIERPIYAQWEIAEALKKYNVIVPDKNVAKPKGGYLGTIGDIEQWRDRGLKNVKTVILVTHPYYAYRPREILRNVAERRNQKIKVLIADTSSVPFDPDSLQDWTRNLNKWVRYEVCNRFSNRYRGNMGEM